MELEVIKNTGKIKVFDVAECNPRFDLDNRTAKLAAYIIYNYIFDWWIQQIDQREKQNM